MPGDTITVRLNCEIEGVGVDPNYPPLVWEAFCGDRWVACDLDRDGTGGLNRQGEVVLHVPVGHQPRRSSTNSGPVGCAAEP